VPETRTLDGAEALRTLKDVEAFLFDEAALLDARAFDAWLELFAEDAVYWIPSGADQIDPEREVSIVYERRAQLAERVWRLDSGLAYAQEPQSRTSHLVSNVRVSGVDDDGLLRVDAAFVVSEFRRDRLATHAGRYRYVLRPREGGFSIVLKKVELIDNDGHLGNLSLVL